jgi:hypothetical protein
MLMTPLRIPRQMCLYTFESIRNTVSNIILPSFTGNGLNMNLIDWLKYIC